MTLTTVTNGWVLRPKRNDKAELRLLCFPYAGGGASTFNSWPNQLPPQIEICSIQLPGRETRRLEPPFTHLTNLVEALAEVLSPYLNMPFSLFGHSMGGLISFELARQFRRELKMRPVHLFISGHRAPQLPDPHPPVHQLPEGELLLQLRRLEGTSEDVLQNSELMELFLPLLRADFALCETYVYSTEEPLDCPISAFGGAEDHRVSREELSAWREQTRGSFKLRVFPGRHFFLHSARVLFLRVLAQDLVEGLRRLSRG